MLKCIRVTKCCQIQRCHGSSCRNAADSCGVKTGWSQKRFWSNSPNFHNNGFPKDRAALCNPTTAAVIGRRWAKEAILKGTASVTAMHRHLYFRRKPRGKKGSRTKECWAILGNCKSVLALSLGKVRCKSPSQQLKPHKLNSVQSYHVSSMGLFLKKKHHCQDSR